MWQDNPALRVGQEHTISSVLSNLKHLDGLVGNAIISSAIHVPVSAFT